MDLPIWLDEHGKRRPTRPCPKCGLPDPVLRLRYEHLLANGWKPFKPFFMVNWCGHGHEYQPWLQPERLLAAGISVGTGRGSGALTLQQSPFASRALGSRAPECASEDTHRLLKTAWAFSGFLSSSLVHYFPFGPRGSMVCCRSLPVNLALSIPRIPVVDVFVERRGVCRRVPRHLHGHLPRSVDPAESKEFGSGAVPGGDEDVVPLRLCTHGEGPLSEQNGVLRIEISEGDDLLGLADLLDRIDAGP